MSHFFGAYLKVSTKITTKSHYIKACEAGHVSTGGEFCSKCGKPVIEMCGTKEEYPTFYTFADILGEDLLADITPPILKGRDAILLADNVGRINDTWLYIGDWVHHPEIMYFPTPEEIEQMKSELEDFHHESIAKLRNHPLVSSVVVRCGYVYNPR